MKFRDHFTGAGKPILQLVTFCNRLYVGMTTVQKKIAQLFYRHRPSLISYFLNGKSTRKYRANVPKNIRMVVDLSPDGAAYFSTQIKTPTFENVAQSSPDWASIFF